MLIYILTGLLIYCFKHIFSEINTSSIKRLHVLCKHITASLLLSTAERRGTPVLLSASVSNNSGNTPQMAAPRGRVK